MARPVFLLALLATSVSAFAIAPDNGATTSFEFVGQIGGASGVAIGLRSVITAKHVGGMGFSVGGNSYTAVSRINHPTLDLSILNFDTDLPGFYAIGNASPLGSTLTLVGYGQTGVLNATGDGYTITGGGGVRRMGTSSLDGKQFVNDFGPSLLSFLVENGDGVLVAGDSGGGFFIGNQLVGVNSFVFTTNENLPAYGFASQNGGTPYYGSGGIDLTDPGVRAWVNSAVPEPATMLGLGLGLAALARRRRR
ncbi:MAG: PEP-CTERM sorting domain-containing protein [Fimbriimonadaceae bacterium]|nr:PEP-CTERM sorting domain-containing protein [Fimbriimonadaceae bacterium]